MFETQWSGRGWQISFLQLKQSPFGDDFDATQIHRGIKYRDRVRIIQHNNHLTRIRIEEGLSVLGAGLQREGETRHINSAFSYGKKGFLNALEVFLFEFSCQSDGCTSFHLNCCESRMPYTKEI